MPLFWIDSNAHSAWDLGGSFSVPYIGVCVASRPAEYQEKKSMNHLKLVTGSPQCTIGTRLFDRAHVWGKLDEISCHSPELIEQDKQPHHKQHSLQSGFGQSSLSFNLMDNCVYCSTNRRFCAPRRDSRRLSFFPSSFFYMLQCSGTFT